MEFTVPKFIEREPKIIGPFTFKQFIFIAIAGAGCFLFYFLGGKENLPLFIIITAVLMGGALTLCFLKIKGYTLPAIIKNFFIYLVSAKVFLWRRKILPPKIKKMKKFEKAETEEETVLKITEKSHLQKLSTQVETRIIK